MTRAWRAHLLLAGAAVAALAAGCGGGSSPSSPAFGLEVDFISESGEGYIPQTLTLQNLGRDGVVPKLEIVPLDAAGKRVEGVTARTAAGSDRGEVLVPPGGDLFDIVRFEGPRWNDVVEADVRVTASARVEAPVWDKGALEGYRIDAAGTRLDFGLPFRASRVENPNSSDVKVQAFLVELDVDLAEDEHQQFLQVIPLGGPATVGAFSEVDLKRPPDVPEDIPAVTLVVPVR